MAVACSVCPSNFMFFIAVFTGLSITVVSTSTICNASNGFPAYCPQPGQAPNRTQCCRRGHWPSCCEERSTNICAKSPTGARSSGVYNPDWNLVFCPLPGQADSYTACCYNERNVFCCKEKNFVGLYIGIGLACLCTLPAVIFLVVLCCKLKKGEWVCVMIKPGNRRYKAITRARFEYLQQKQQIRQQQQQQQVSNTTSTSI